MLALKLYGRNDIRLQEEPIPQITDDEILLKTEAAAVCGTDIRMWRNGKEGVDKEHPLTLGHEFAGRIVAVGRNVPHYKTGMRIAMQPNIGCGICDHCVAGNFHLCDEYKAFGINMDGAMAEYVKIPKDAILKGNLIDIPENLRAETAAIAEPLSCAYNGFSKCFVKLGDKALVAGAGPIGMCHAILLHMAGANVLMNDVQQERLEYCQTLLPFVSIYCGGDLAGHVNEWTEGKGLDVAITACPVPGVQAAMLPLMNYGGRINFFGGLPEGREMVELNTNIIHYKELYITGSTRSSITQFRKVMDLIRHREELAGALITDRYKITEAESAFENAAGAKGMKHVILF